MGINLIDIFSLLSQPPGSLVYHSLLSLVWLWIVVVSSVNLSKKRHQQAATHLLTGSVILLALQIAMLCLEFILFPGADNQTGLYLMIQFCAGALLILWLTWTFLQERKPFVFTGLSIFTTLALFLFISGSILISILQPENLINLTYWLPLLWEGISLALLLVGCILSLVTKPEQWGAALMILFTLAFGYALPRLSGLESDSVLGALRLAHLLSLPWSFILLQRLSTKRQGLQISIGSSLASDDKTDPTPILVDELLQIALQESSTQRAKAVARALSYSVIADVCYIAQISHELETVQLIAGYDLIREEDIPTAELPCEKLLHIMDAWEVGRSLALSEDVPKTRDAETLTLLLHYHRLGNLLAVPLSLPERGLVGGAIFLSPYTDKAWGEKVSMLMDRIKPTLFRVLFEPLPFERIKADLAEAKAATEDLLAEKQALTKAFTQLGTTIEEQEGTIRQFKARYQVERLEHVKQLQDYQTQINTLQSEAASLSDKIVNQEQLQEKIRQISKARDTLKMDIARLKVRLQELEGLSGQTGPVRLSMENQILSLNTVLAKVRQATAPQLQSKSLQLEIINPDGEQMIRTDPILLHAALEGLLENAAEASQTGNKIQIHQELSFETGMLIVQITDFGEGLTEAEQHAFFSAEGATPPGIGSLAAIREAIRAIRLLSGKIWIKSEKDHFTTFKIQLPVRIMD